MEPQIQGQTSIEVQEPGIENAGKATKVDTMLSLETLIKRHAESIEKLKLELRQHREMYQDSFNNNPTYREHNEKVKDAGKARSVVKQQIALQPSVKQLKQKVDDIRFDIKEQQRTLSDLLVDYKEQTGATQLELFSGEMVDMVQSVKLVKSSRRR